MNERLFLTMCVIISSMTLSACRILSEPERISCDELLAVSLRPYIGQLLTPNSFIAAVENAYGVAQQKVTLQTSEESYWKVSWTHKGLHYSTWTKSDGTIGPIVIQHGKPRVATVGQFSDCVGSEPGWYSAYYGMQAPTPGLTYHLALYFPEQGYVTTSTDYTERDEPTPDLTADLSLDDVIINTPTSLFDLYEQRWGFSIEAARPAWKPTPWPGDWKAVEWVEDREAESDSH